MSFLDVHLADIDTIVLDPRFLSSTWSEKRSGPSVEVE
jgi:hypothetical protein